MPLFWFTLRQTIRDRKIWLAVLLLAGPCFLLFLFRILPSDFTPNSRWQSYHDVMQFIILMAAVPLICMLYGPALVGSEAESGTLVYLLTRRMRRATVLLVRFVAIALVFSVILALASVACHLATFAGTDETLIDAPSTDGASMRDLTCYLSVAPTAVMVFLAIFTAISLITARPLVFSGFYLVIVEIVISNLPISARAYSVTHQLRKTMTASYPELRNLYSLSDDLAEQLYPSGSSGTMILIGLMIVLLALGCVLVSLRELVPSKVARE